MIVHDDKPFWAVVDAPFSRFTEAIRSIKLAVDLDGAIEANRVIGFTSSIPNEGKSTTAAALALLMSQVNARTLRLIATYAIRHCRGSSLLTQNTDYLRSLPEKFHSKTLSGLIHPIKSHSCQLWLEPVWRIQMKSSAQSVSSRCLRSSEKVTTILLLICHHLHR